MLGFSLDIWDYLTFLVLLIAISPFIALVIFILGLPRRIAVSRRHPEAEAVNIMGWAGAFAVLPWIRAFIWAFKPTEVIDIRYLPEATRRETELVIAKLRGKSASDKAPGTS